MPISTACPCCHRPGQKDGTCFKPTLSLVYPRKGKANRIGLVVRDSGTLPFRGISLHLLLSWNSLSIQRAETERKWLSMCVCRVCAAIGLGTHEGVSRASHHPTADDPTILAGKHPGVLLIDIGSGLWSIIKFSAQSRLSISPVKSLFLTHPLKQGITNIDRHYSMQPESLCLSFTRKRPTELPITRAVAVVCCVLLRPLTSGMD